MGRRKVQVKCGLGSASLRSFPKSQPGGLGCRTSDCQAVSSRTNGLVEPHVEGPTPVIFRLSLGQMKGLESLGYLILRWSSVGASQFSQEGSKSESWTRLQRLRLRTRQPESSNSKPRGMHSFPSVLAPVCYRLEDNGDAHVFVGTKPVYWVGAFGLAAARIFYALPSSEDRLGARAGQSWCEGLGDSGRGFLFASGPGRSVKLTHQSSCRKASERYPSPQCSVPPAPLAEAADVQAMELSKLEARLPQGAAGAFCAERFLPRRRRPRMRKRRRRARRWNPRSAS